MTARLEEREINLVLAIKKTNFVHVISGREVKEGFAESTGMRLRRSLQRLIFRL